MQVFAITAFTATFIASGAFAESHTTSPISGFGQINVNTSVYDYPDGGWDGFSPFDGLGFEGALAYSFGNGSTISVEVSSSEASDIGDEYPVDLAMAAIHFNWDMSFARVGVFAGAMTASDYFSSPSSDYLIAGIEAQRWFNNQVLIQGDITSIQFQAGEYDMGNNVMNVGLGVQYFATDNLMYGANLGLLTGQVGDDVGEDANALRWEIESAYQFDDMPLSIFTTVSGMNDQNWLDDPTAQGVLTAGIGVRWSFGGGTLKSQADSIAQVSDLSAVPWLRLDGDW